MSKKDYIAVAAIISKHVDENNENCPSARAVRLVLNDVANDFCEVFQSDNHLFDKHRFKVACGLIP